MSYLRWLPAVILTASEVTSVGTAAPVEGLKPPAGFVVTEFAGPDLANDIYCLHISADGRVLVAGRGYVRELIDVDAAGRADRAVELVTGLREGPMGILLERQTLFLVADGGLKKYPLRPGAATDAAAAELVFPVKTGGEHDAHAVRRGPDGALYLLCGNMAGVSGNTITAPASPVREPMAGCLLRFPPDGRGVEVLADGFRNPYDFDFDPAGDAFTFDSDNERCVGLPWYEPTRFYRIVPGGRYGWLSPQVAQTWRMPPYFWDVVPPLATAGRGSPTGVCCYRHTAFPGHYHGGFFLGDWTFGRVLYIPPPGSGGAAPVPEPFVVSVGDSGFAPTGLAVHPATGDLYVSTGGRGTRGAVYRIRPTTPTPAPHPISFSLRAPTRGEGHGGPMATPAAQLTTGEWLDMVRRTGGVRDRYSHSATARLRVDVPTAKLVALMGQMPTAASRIELGFATVHSAPEVVRHEAIATVRSPRADNSDRLDAVRLIQVALGDLTDPKSVGTTFEGYTPRRAIDPTVTREVAEVIREVFPTNHHDLDRELSRTLAVLADPESASVEKLLGTLTPRSDVVDDLHTIIVLARLTARRTPEHTRRTVDALLRLEEKAVRAALPRDRHWPLRVSEAAEALAKNDPALAGAIIASPRFGLAGHVDFARLPGFDRATAARRFMARASDDADFGWQPEHVRLLGELPVGETRGLLEALWHHGGLEDAIVPLLARDPSPADRDKFLAALRSSNATSVAAAAVALRSLPAADGSKELAALIRALRTLPADQAGPRRELAATLKARTGTDLGPDTRAWAQWVDQNRPAAALELATTTAGVAELRRRVAGINWAAGDAGAGRRVFAKATCAACHNGAQAVGPSLEGVAGRFSRDDLITAVIDPGRDVSPRYRLTKVTTDDGKVYQGVIIYEASDGVLLQTGATETVRLAGSRIESKQSLDASLMPAGLLDPLTDKDISDLFAYLKSLGKPSLKP